MSGDYGFFLSGLFIGSGKYEGTKRTSYYVMVSTGSDAYRVYMNDPAPDLTVGSELMISCRPFVNKAGYLNFANGKIV